MGKQLSKFAAVLAHTRESESEGVEKAAEDHPKLRGKRTRPDYTQVTAYIPRVLHEDVKILLVREREHDFSTLVASLLAEWSQARQAPAAKG